MSKHWSPGRKKREKKKKKLLNSRRWICRRCGHIGYPLRMQKGCWYQFKLRAIISFPILGLVILLSLLEGFLRMITMQKPQSVIWSTKMSRFIPDLPYMTYSCKRCGGGNVMHKLRSHKGKMVYERYESDRFLRTHHHW